MKHRPLPNDLSFIFWKGNFLKQKKETRGQYFLGEFNRHLAKCRVISKYCVQSKNIMNSWNINKCFLKVQNGVFLVDGKCQTSLQFIGCNCMYLYLYNPFIFIQFLYIYIIPKYLCNPFLSFSFNARQLSWDGERKGKLWSRCIYKNTREAKWLYDVQMEEPENLTQS